MKVLAESSKKAQSPVEQATILVPEPIAPCNWKHKSLISVLFGSLTIGCLWQIYGISVLHLTTPPTVSIEAKVGQSYKKIPALTFCTNIGDSTNGITSDEFFRSIKAQNLVEYIRVTSSYGGHDLNYTYMITDPVETISYKYYCFTVNSALKGYQMEIKDDQQIWIKLKHIGIYNSWWLFVHNSYDVPSSYEWNARELKKGLYAAISYSHESFQQMTNTYPKNCLDYFLNTEYTSRKDCIRKCKLRESIRRCGVVYNGIDVKKGEESVKFASTDDEKNCVNDFLQFGDDCTRKCHNADCRIDSYKPFLVAKYQNNWDYTIMELIPPNGPEFEYKHKSSIDTRVYFYYLSGNLSVWLGFALYLLYNKCSKNTAPKEVHIYANMSKVVSPTKIDSKKSSK